MSQAYPSNNKSHASSSSSLLDDDSIYNGIPDKHPSDEPILSSPLIPTHISSTSSNKTSPKRSKQNLQRQRSKNFQQQKSIDASLKSIFETNQSILHTNQEILSTLTKLSLSSQQTTSFLSSIDESMKEMLFHQTTSFLSTSKQHTQSTTKEKAKV